MASMADAWWNEDRRELFRSVAIIASEVSTLDQIGASLDTILVDLELYDDPRQGAGMWLFDNELQLAEQFGEQLRDAASDAWRAGAETRTTATPKWTGARATAAQLLRLMEENGDFTR
jgi:hypothetical protein